MKNLAFSLALAAASLLLLASVAAQAQYSYRLNDRQVKYLLERIEKETEKFRSSLKDALKRSRFEGTRSEDNINQLVKDFEKATERLKDRFNETKSAAGYVEELLRQAANIERFMQRTQLAPRAQDDWIKLRNSLDELARAYSLSWSRSGISNQAFRLSDSDVKYLLDRLAQGTKSFRLSLKEALKRTRLERAGGEDSIDRFAKDFEKAVERLRDQFKRDYSAAANVEEVLQRAAPINRFMQSYELTLRAQNDWASLQRELDRLARAYNIS